MSVFEAEPSMRQRAGEQRNGDPYKGSLLRTEGSVSRQNSGEEELKIRRQMHKQESKDSGIVTEMSTRPKDYARSKTEKIHRSDSTNGTKVKHHCKSSNLLYIYLLNLLHVITISTYMAYEASKCAF